MSSPGCETVLDWADLILAAGPLFSDYTTAGWTGLPPRERLISAEPRYVRVPGAEYTHVALAEFLSAVAKNARTNDATLKQYQRIVSTAPAEHEAGRADASAALTRAELWRQIGLSTTRRSRPALGSSPAVSQIPPSSTQQRELSLPMMVPLCLTSDHPRGAGGALSYHLRGGQRFRTVAGRNRPGRRCR